MAQLMTQTTDPFEQELARQSEVPDQARSAFRISAITAAAMVPFTLYNLYVAWLDPNWQQFAHIGLTGLVGLAGLISAWLSRWGRSGFGIMLHHRDTLVDSSPGSVDYHRTRPGAGVGRSFGNGRIGRGGLTG